MTGGSERRSLLDGEISRRESTARDALDQFLVKLVDVFNFQIQEHAVDTAMRTHDRQQQQQQQVRTAASKQDEYATSGIRTPDVVLSPRASAVSDPTGVKPTAGALFMRKLSEKLSEFVLNESLDHAASENPMELGWHKAAAKATTRSSWFADLKDLRGRATMSSEKDLEDDGNDSDVYFQTDDESSGHCTYQIMA